MVEGIRTKKMVADPETSQYVKLMFEMYSEPETSFGDITRYFEEQNIKVYGKSLFRTFISQLLRNPVYAQADLKARGRLLSMTLPILPEPMAVISIRAGT